MEKETNSISTILTAIHPPSPNPNNNNNISPSSPPPLAERMRPQTLNEIVGQDHLSSFIQSAIDSTRLPSLILWGPPGTGKTSIGRAIVNSCTSSSSYRFVSISVVTAGVNDVRDVIDEAKKQNNNNNSNVNGKVTVLFVDEVHRFNKSELDLFLPVIEDGSVVFIGATTENPGFHLIAPLLSRCRVLALNPLQPEDIGVILTRAVDDCKKGLVQSVGGGSVRVGSDVIEFLAEHCDGDARVALNALEVSAICAAGRVGSLGTDGCGELVLDVTLDDAKEGLQSTHLSYDKDGEQQYNLISALIKSMRGSDANASVYWLERMLEGGEQPLYIARRLIQFSSEDVGLADSSALTQAVSCYQACQSIGMPECRVSLAQCVVYMALAPKSVAISRALQAATKVVRDSVGQNEEVPLHLRNGYICPPDEHSASQSYLPVSLQGTKFLDWPDSFAAESDR